jgi:Skp family chaperone for outer membrane proteins
MKPVILFFVLALFTATLSAQEPEHMERIKAQKIAFITEQLALTPAVAQKFWPVYNEFSTKMDNLNNRRMQHKHDLKKEWDTMSARQKEDLVDMQVKHRVEEVQLEQQYHELFKKVLSIDQVMKLYESEKEFKMRLMRQIRGGRGNSGHSPKQTGSGVNVH